MTEKQYDISVSSEIDYISEQSLPEEGRYVFAYTITVTNTGKTAATLLRRHWLITDANCKVQEVRGEGVVGEQPLQTSARSAGEGIPSYAVWYH